VKLRLALLVGLLAVLLVVLYFRGWGGPGLTLRDEVNRIRYVRGSVGLALSGPDTGGSQFFITLADQPHLDGTYPVIGRVLSGMEVVDLITQGDRIRSVRRQ